MKLIGAESNVIAKGFNESDVQIDRRSDNFEMGEVPDYQMRKSFTTKPTCELDWKLQVILLILLTILNSVRSEPTSINVTQRTKWHM